MTQEKLNKYKKGNFKLTSKHVYAYNRLKKIRKHLLKKVNLSQHGGANIEQNRQNVYKLTDNLKTEFFDSNNVEDLINNIKKEAKAAGVMYDENQFEELMNVDKEMLNFFKEFVDLANSEAFKQLDKGKAYKLDKNSKIERDTDNNPVREGDRDLRQELLRIQKGMFDLQVKIIFNKLENIKADCEDASPVNVTKLFTVIANKIDAMNKYMDTQQKQLPINQKEANEERSHIQVNKEEPVNEEEQDQKKAQEAREQEQKAQEEGKKKEAQEAQKAQEEAQKAQEEAQKAQQELDEEEAKKTQADKRELEQQEQQEQQEPDQEEANKTQKREQQKPRKTQRELDEEEAKKTQADKQALKIQEEAEAQKREQLEQQEQERNQKAQQALKAQEKPEETEYNSEIFSPIDVTPTEFKNQSTKPVKIRAKKIYQSGGSPSKQKKKYDSEYNYSSVIEQIKIIDSMSDFMDEGNDNSSSSRILYNNIIYLYNIGSQICNNQNILKLCTCMINAKNFKTYTGKDKVVNYKIYKQLFVELDTTVEKNLINSSKSMQINILTDEEIKNDTLIFNTFMKEIKNDNNDNVIYIYRLITRLYNSIIKNNINSLTGIPDLMKTINYITEIITLKIDNIITFLNIDHIDERINNIYYKILEEINPVLVYVKERCDTTTSNPRYYFDTKTNDNRVALDDDISYRKFELTYYNNPFKVGCFNIIRKSYNLDKYIDYKDVYDKLNKLSYKDKIKDINNKTTNNGERFVVELPQLNLIKINRLELGRPLELERPDPTINMTKLEDIINKKKELLKIVKKHQIKYTVEKYKECQLSFVNLGDNMEPFIDNDDENKRSYYNYEKAKIELNYKDTISKIDPDTVYLTRSVPNIKKKQTTVIDFRNDFRNFYGKFNNKPLSNYTKKEHYYLGVINKYYDKENIQYTATDNDCGSKMLQKIINGEDVIIIGYGQSGSGKTSELIMNTATNTPGLLPKTLNEIPIKMTNDEYKLEVDFIDIYLNWGYINSMNYITRNHYLIRSLGKDYFAFNTKAKEWRLISLKTDSGAEIMLRTPLQDRIMYRFTLREEEPTENNPNSSRSHVLVHIKVKNSDGKIISNIVVGDLAGVENRFTCKPSRLVILDNTYRNLSNKYRNKPIYFDNFICGKKKKKFINFKINLEKKQTEDGKLTIPNLTNEDDTRLPITILRMAKILRLLKLKNVDNILANILKISNIVVNIDPDDEIIKKIKSNDCFIKEEEEYKNIILDMKSENKFRKNFLDFYEITEEDNINIINNKMVTRLNDTIAVYKKHMYCSINNKNINNTEITSGMSENAKMIINHIYRKNIIHSYRTHDAFFSTNPESIKLKMPVVIAGHFPLEEVKHKKDNALLISPINKRISVFVKDLYYNYLIKGFMAQLQNDIRSHLNLVEYYAIQYKKFIKSIVSDIINYNIIYFNCCLRRKEGYFINKSLLSLKTAISKFITKNIQHKYKTFNNITNSNPNIINYLGPTIDDCYNNNLITNNFDFFNINLGAKDVIEPYNKTNIAITNEDEGEILFRIIFEKYKVGESRIYTGIDGFKLDYTKVSFIVFTVINLSDSNISDKSDTTYTANYIINPFGNILQPNNPKDNDDPQTDIILGPTNIQIKQTNNTPNPPYINVNKLKIAFNIIKYFKEIYNYYVLNSLQKDVNTIETINTRIGVTLTKEKLNNYTKFTKLFEPINDHLTKYLKKFKKRISLYPYYANNNDVLSKISEDGFTLLNITTSDSEFTKKITNIKYLIEIIEANNDTTLIGTTNFFNFTQIQPYISNITSSPVICDGTIDDNNISIPFNNSPLINPLENKKYLEATKYKNEYYDHDDDIDIINEYDVEDVKDVKDDEDDEDDEDDDEDDD
jgi:hypothetical protein